MKRRHLLPVVILLAMAVDLSAWSGAQRRDWWKLRERAFRAELAQLEKNPSIDPAVLGLVRADIDRAAEVIGMFERAAEKGAATVVKPSGADITPDCIAGAVFSACLLEYLTSSAGHRDNYRAVHGAAGAEIRRMIRSTFGADDDELLHAVMTDDISRVEWQYCTLEAFYSAATRESGHLRACVIASALEDMKREAAPEVSRNDKVRLAAEKTLAACASVLTPSSILITASDLAASPSWKSARARTASRLALMRELREMSDTGGESLAPVHLRGMLDDAAATEKLVFSRAARRYFDRRNIDTAAGKRPSAAGTVIRIPKNVDGTLLFRDLDDARREAAGAVRGDEDAAFFRAAEKRLSSIVERYTAETSAEFIAGEERLQRMRDDGMSGEAINEKEFLQAKAVYADRMALVRGYVLRSTRYLRWLSSSRSLDGAAILASLKERAAANRGYIAFADGLAAEGQALAGLRQPGIQKRYAIASRNIEGLRRAAVNSMSLDRNTARFLSPAMHAEARTVRNDLNEFINKSRTENAARLAAFSRSVARESARRAESAAAPDAETASFEIERMMKRIDEYSTVYAGLNRTADMLGRYAKLYTELESSLGRGEKPGRIDEVIAKKSILHLVDGYDGAALRSELSTASYLRREIGAEIARVSTLLGDYRRKGIDPRGAPSERDLAARKSALAAPPSMMIASWSMNGANMEEVDRKAARHLAGMYHRMVWRSGVPRRGNDEAVRSGAGRSVNAGSPLIPAGWTESEPDGDEAAAGVIKRFSSSDRTASITIARVQAGGRMLNEIGARWAKERGAGIVKQRWGKKENTDYFWTLARSPERSVMELYVLETEEGAIVVSGTAPRDRYTAFKARLDAVFESMAR
jgi:hypothetical protein